MKFLYSIFFVIFGMTLGFSQEYDDMDFSAEDVAEVSPIDLLTPNTIEQRLYAKSHYGSSTYDSVRYFFAEASDGFYSILTTYRYDSDSILTYDMTDTLEFDSQDRLVSRISYKWDQGDFYLQNREIVSYSGLNELRLFEYYSLGSWVNDKKVLTEYFANGQVKEKLDSLWDTAAQEWTFYSYNLYNEDGYALERQWINSADAQFKYVYERNANNKLLKFTEFNRQSDSDPFVFAFKSEWTPVGDTLTTGYTYNWTGSDWSAKRKIIKHYENGNLVEKLELDSVGPGQYINYKLSSYIYTSISLLSYQIKYWNANLTPPAWELARELVGIANSDDLVTKRTWLAWNPDSLSVVPMSIWNIDYDLYGNVIYDDFLVRDAASGAWKELSRNYWYYEDYVTALRDIRDLAPLSLKVFPNPSADYIVFDTEQPIKTFSVQFFTANGSALFSRKISTNQQVDIRALPRGMYYYIVKGDGIGATGKFVKE